MNFQCQQETFPKKRQKLIFILLDVTLSNVDKKINKFVLVPKRKEKCIFLNLQFELNCAKLVH